MSTDIDFEFLDVTPSLTAGALDWVTIDKTTNIIKVTVPADAFKTYNLQTLWVGIRATMRNSPNKENYDKSFSIYFESLEIAYCSTSTFTAPLVVPSDLSIRVYDIPTEVIIDPINDTGSTQLGMTPGFESANCGPF